MAESLMPEIAEICRAHHDPYCAVCDDRDDELWMTADTQPDPETKDVDA